jgi:serine protease Do
MVWQMKLKKLLGTLCMGSALLMPALPLFSCNAGEKSQIDPAENFAVKSTVMQANADITSSRQNAITETVKIASPAIVGINVTEVRQVGYDPFGGGFADPFFDQFFNNFRRQFSRKMEVRGLGSGFLISSDGYIVTNDHVAGNASKVVITTTNGEKFDAEIIGSDPVSDVALLKIKGKNFPYLKFANSDEVLVGEWSIAFGNPFGLFDINARPTVTVGVVSNTGVSFSQENRIYRNMIQTDAAISSGNSGGPLLNARGEVIGVNTVIYSTAQNTRGAGSIGIGFAVPINRVKKVVEQLKDKGKIDRDFNAGLVVQLIDENVAKYFRLEKKEGVVVVEVKNNSAASKAGIEPGDIIVEADGIKIHREDDLIVAINDGIAGQTINLSILRSGDLITKKMYLEKSRR